MIVNFAQRLKMVSPNRIIVIGVIGSEVLTFIVVSIMSMMFNGRITYDYLITGAIAALIVSFVVILIIVSLLKILKENEERYRRLIEYSPDAIAVHREGRIVFINPAALKLMGVKDEKEALGKPVLDFVHPDCRDIVKKRIQQAMHEKATMPLNEEKFIRFDGKEIYVEVMGGPIIYENKPAIQVIFHDITSRKLIEEKTNELNELKDKFIKIITHQLRTPINEIKWNLELVLGEILGKTTKDQEQLMKTTYDANERVIAIINDLMTVLDIERQRINLGESEACLNDLVDSLIVEYDKNIKIKKLKIIFANSERRSRLSIDPVKIRSAIAKLLDNAIKYTHEEGEIAMRIEEKDGKVLFTISDNGMGIPADEQGKIFNKFYRATNAFLSFPDASGLGLFIAKAEIEAHGGEIWFDSQEGTGSNFYFKLPIKSESKNI